ncbi:hypothetical protein JCM30471_08120 [Desulfuromonas carbonis]
MKKKILILFCSLLLCAWLPRVAASDGNETAALESATAFLALLDQGDIAAAFDATSSFHRSFQQRERWVASIATQRSFYGPLVNRVASKAVSKNSYPKNPDGVYLVIVFQSSFAHKRQTTEIVAVTADANGFWRVSDYICN